MERRTGSLNVNFREIARELGVSAMTVYRVVNLDPAVRRETRERVTDALNRCGFFTHRRGKRFKVFLSHLRAAQVTAVQIPCVQNYSSLRHLLPVPPPQEAHWSHIIILNSDSAP